MARQGAHNQLQEEDGSLGECNNGACISDPAKTFIEVVRLRRTDGDWTEFKWGQKRVSKGNEYVGNGDWRVWKWGMEMVEIGT